METAHSVGLSLTAMTQPRGAAPHARVLRQHGLHALPCSQITKAAQQAMLMQINSGSSRDPAPSLLP